MATKDSEPYDSRIPGGGSMYCYRRVDETGPDGKTRPKLACLGCGGFASTMDCIKINGIDRIPVAIKQISMDKKAAARLEEQEMRGLQALTGRVHPNLVRYMGYFSGDDGGGRTRLSFVFERCPTAVSFQIVGESNGKGFTVPTDSPEQSERQGCDLVSNPTKRPPYTLREARYVAQQLLSVCAYLHGSLPPIIHRDIKPDNVLIWGVTDDRETGEQLLDVKLTDYGTLRRADTSDMTVGQGTKSFMAPEVDVQTGVGRGDKPVGTYNTSVDIFSVGATFFYLVTGEAPSGSTRKHWLQRFGSETVYTPKRNASASGRQASERRTSIWDVKPPAAAAAATAAATSAAGCAGSAADGKGASKADGAGGGAAAGSSSSDASAASAGAAGKKESVLEHFFPTGSLQRVFLEGLVNVAPAEELPPGTAPRRWTAVEAQKWLETKWPLPGKPTPAAGGAAGGAAPGQ